MAYPGDRYIISGIRQFFMKKNLVLSKLIITFVAV